MAISAGTNARITAVAEATRNTKPGTSPAWGLGRFTSLNINLEKNILESAEIRSTRQRADVRHGFNRVTGSLGFQVSHRDHDLYFETLMGSTFATVGTGVATLAIDGAANSVTRASGSFVTDGFRPGDQVELTGFTGSLTDDYTVASVTATILVIVQDIAATQAAAGTREVDVKGARLGIGTTLKTLHLERGFTDINQFQTFGGCNVNEMGMSISPEAIATGTMGIIGMSAAAISGSSSSGTLAATSTNDVFAAFDGILVEGGAEIAVCTQLDFSVNNNRSLEGVIGSKFSPDVFDGTAIVTGSATFFFENETLFNKFVNETESSLSVKLANPGGTDFLNISFPRIKYTGANIDPPQSGPVRAVFPFEALEPSGGSAIYLQRSDSA